jgi:phage gpG-like protein
MAAGVSVKLYPDKLAAVLHGRGGGIARDLSRRGVRVESRAKQLCPVGTPESTGKKGYRGGRLRQSITWELGVDAEGLFVDVGTNVEYALFVHDGTRYMQGRPFLTDALVAAR